MKAAVIYWSGTGNTEQMANAIAEGAGAELFSVSDFTGDIADYDRIAFGCSAMGDEVLEESEFEPFFTAIEGALSGKTIALFGSYGWGDGEWMRNWEERAKADGAVLVNGEGLIVNETPSDEDLETGIQGAKHLIPKKTTPKQIQKSGSYGKPYGLFLFIDAGKTNSFCSLGFPLFAAC